jgi:hypothetical protein
MASFTIQVEFTGERTTTMTDIFGCACCSGEFGRIFRSNRAVQDMASSDPSTALPIIPGILTRRDVLKGGIATLGTLSLVACGSESNGVAAKVFTGGTILTVDTDFSEAEAIAIRRNG